MNLNVEHRKIYLLNNRIVMNYKLINHNNNLSNNIGRATIYS